MLGKRGGRVWTEGNDEEMLARGVFDTYVKRNLRYSQARRGVAPCGPAWRRGGRRLQCCMRICARCAAPGSGCAR